MPTKIETEALRTALSQNNIVAALALFEQSKTMSPNMKEPVENGVPLLQAAVRGQLSTGEKFDGQRMLAGLIALGADVNMRLPNGRTVLHEPGLSPDAARSLLEAGANIEAKVSKPNPEAGQVKGETPLLSQIKANNGEVARLLVDAGANVKARDQDRVTAVHAAAYVKDSRTAAYVLDSGADIDALTVDKESAKDALIKNGFPVMAATSALVKARSRENVSEAELLALAAEQRNAIAAVADKKQQAQSDVQPEAPPVPAAPTAENTIEQGSEQNRDVDPQTAAIVAQQREALREAAKRAARSAPDLEPPAGAPAGDQKDPPSLDSQARDFAQQRRAKLDADRQTDTPELESADAEARQFAARQRERVLQQRALLGLNERQGPSGRTEAPQRGDTADVEREEGPKRKTPDDRSKAVPQHVKQKFLQVKDQYYFPDKTHAFDDRGQKLSTKSESQQVISSLVDIAKERGWEHVTVRGTKDFRRAAWLEASLNGLEVSGYRPSVIEKAQLAKLVEKNVRDVGLDNSIEASPERAKPAPAKTQNDPEQAAPGGKSLTGEVSQPKAKTDAEITVPKFAVREGVVVGQLIEHGLAKYQFDETKTQSYFVKVMTQSGEQIVWGMDLKRAMREGQAKPGETVALEKVASKDVVAKENVVDEKGNIVGTRDVDAIRNTWKVGSVDKAQAFVQGDRSEVVAKHPELASAYGIIAAAHKFAEQTFPKNKAEQERFVAIAQADMAERIAHGDHVPSLKIKEAKVVKEQGKDQDRGEPAKPSDREHAR
ncbi:LPD7 domain-containing protein [Pseudomonas viridiflava]|uniref:LPD7 domain-containing protein n=1 Tax=Pseudomonas viridiflava TaxID=33069 RepID=UPI000F01BBA6|nr:LPD7 domain-containing protein [Pseudomonas viridiflava]